MSNNQDNQGSKAPTGLPKHVLDDLGVSKLSLTDVINRAPTLVGEIINQFDTDEEKLISLFATPVILGALLPEVHSDYDGSITHPHLMLILSFPPASGKGILKYHFKLIDEVVKSQNEAIDAEFKSYKVQYKLWKEQNDPNVPMPEKPPRPIILIPANTTSAMLTQQMAVNEKFMCSLIMETEADALTNMINSPHGIDNSVNIRKAFHNEPISLMRKTKDERHYISRPKLVLLMTCTPGQLKKLFYKNDDGLFSRFMLVTGNSPLKWKDVSPNPSKVSKDEYFQDLGKTKIFSFYNFYKNRKLKVEFNDYQWRKINSIGAGFQLRAAEEGGEQAIGIAHRHMNMVIRIASVFTAIRMFELDKESEMMYCSPVDFENALWMVNHSFECSLEVFNSLGVESKKTPSRIMEFYEKLPKNQLFKIKDLTGCDFFDGIPYRTKGDYVLNLVKMGKLASPRYSYYKKNVE